MKRNRDPLKHAQYNRENARKQRLLHPEKVRVRGRLNAKRWYHQNIDKCRAYHRNRIKLKRSQDHRQRVLHCLRERIRKALRGIAQSGRTMELLSCPMWSFKIYLESLFEVGMTWENYGTVWEVDHIIPCALFDLTKPDHQHRCFHFSNMQPMFVSENRAKGKKYCAPS